LEAILVKYLKLFESFSEDYSDKNRGLLLKNNKKFWIASVNIIDGEIEETHTYQKAADNDFHHSLYFSIDQLEKIENGECMIFWISEYGDIQYHEKIAENIIDKIKKQIKII